MYIMHNGRNQTFVWIMDQRISKISDIKSDWRTVTAEHIVVVTWNGVPLRIKRWSCNFIHFCRYCYL